MFSESFEPRLRLLAEGYRKRYGALFKYSVEDEMQRFKEYKEQLRPYIVDAVNVCESRKSRNVQYSLKVLRP